MPLSNLSTSASLSTPGRSKSVVRELLVLPSACSLLARVSAMHNYSSRAATSSSSSPSSSPPAAAAAGCGMYSAPQSPSVSWDRPPLRQRLDRRCMSTPASPSHSATTRTVRRSSRRRRRQRATSAWHSSASDDSDSGISGGVHVGGGKRAHHNVLERRRRDHLKYSFEALRAVVPGTATDVRIPKVAILRRARDHVRQLTSTSRKLCTEYARLKCLQERWTHKLAAVTEHVRLAQLGLGADDDDLSTLLVQAAA